MRPDRADNNLYFIIVRDKNLFQLSPLTADYTNPEQKIITLIVMDLRVYSLYRFIQPAVWGFINISDSGSRYPSSPVFRKLVSDIVHVCPLQNDFLPPRYRLSVYRQLQLL